MGKRDASHFITEYYTECGKVELMIPTDATDDDFALLKDILALVEAKMKQRADRKTENCSEKPNNSKVSEIPSGSTRSKMEQVDKDINVRSKDEPQIEYCPRCGMRILVDKPKDEPQTCSFSDCDNFKNPDYERCIECKRKQIKLKTDQTERSSDDIHIKSSTADRSLSARTRNRNNNSDGHIVFSEVTERSE